eukprot:scaffold10820_cov132-Isochrysis_galbana.AAC.2
MLPLMLFVSTFAWIEESIAALPIGRNERTNNLELASKCLRSRLGAAKYSPITVTDVQSDGRPRAVPRDSHGALPICDAVAALRKLP